jgi:5-methylcytosine-specific restriction endonuclease McrA
MKKSMRRQIEDDLDDLFSIIIRSKGRCEKCGKVVNLVTAHIFSRRNLATRWDKNNAFCLCIECHSWGHQNLLLFIEFAKEKLGNERYEELEKKSIGIKKWSIIELENLYEEFKKLYKGESK